MDEAKATKIFNKTEYKQRRQELRCNMTEPEKRLWQILRNHQMGVKFRRQHGIGDYIADFYCPELKLVIEVDGDSHFSEAAQGYDKVRDGFMLSLNIVTIRLKNDDVMQNIEGVYQYVKHQIDLRFESTPSNSPLTGGGHTPNDIGCTVEGSSNSPLTEGESTPSQPSPSSGGGADSSLPCEGEG